jgi:hypothetical protein
MTQTQRGTSRSASPNPYPTIAGGEFFRIGGVKLYGLILFHELLRVEPAADGRAFLAGPVAARVVRPHVRCGGAVERHWLGHPPAARPLLRRQASALPEPSIV